MLTNFDTLKERDAELYKLAQAYTGCKSGDHKLDESRFPAEIWQRLVEFNKPVVPALEEQRPDPSVRVREDVAVAAANGRLLQLQDEEGLLDNQANGKLIGDYFRDNKLTFTVANVNKAIAALRADLAWRPNLKEAPPAAPAPAAQAAALRVDLDLLRSKHSALYNTVVRMIGHHSGIREVDARSLTVEAQGKLRQCTPVEQAPPVPTTQPSAPAAEVLGTLSDGSQQLPLSATPDKHASVAQLKDWLARTREATGKYVRPRGSWGTSL